jgi:aminoglycoside phosphotransferase (APT) family kinase protein
MEKRKILEPREVILAIRREYPALRQYHMRVSKQFSSKDGRKYNVFLIEAPDSPWKRFIAKSYWFEGHDLRDEVRMFELLEKKNVSAPRILIPYVEGNTFLVMSFVEGKEARDLVDDIDRVNDVFQSIGVTLRQIYSVSVPGFGKFWEDSTVGWPEYIDEKFDERLTSLIPEKLIPGIKEIYKAGKVSIAKDAEQGPVLIHRDIYTDNFIVEKETGRAVLIDFAMAIGGRPFYDLAKFYVIDISRHPEGQKPFLDGLGITSRGKKDLEMLRAYTVIELMGMINFFNSIGDERKRQEVEASLFEIVQKEGKFNEIIEDFAE